MCQGCHLHYDREHHAQTRAKTRAAEQAAAGQFTLFSADDAVAADQRVPEVAG
jgi:hypothetical protein